MKRRLTIGLTGELWRAVSQYRHERGIASMSQTIIALVEIALASLRAKGE